MPVFSNDVPYFRLVCIGRSRFESKMLESLDNEFVNVFKTSHLSKLFYRSDSGFQHLMLWQK